MPDTHANFIAAIIARPGDDLMRTAYADFLEGTAGGTKCHICVGGFARVAAFPAPRVEKCLTCHGTGEVSNGHAERSEFIRVQCELAQLIGDGSRCPVCDWPIREDGSGCQPDNCSFRPSEHTSEHARWLPRQKHFHALRRRERELLDANYSAWIEPAVLSRRVPGHAMPVGTARSGSRYEYLPIFRRGFVESITCSWSNFRTHADAIRRATPLREVTLTTWPIGRNGPEQEYPGITFHLPTTSHRPLQPAGR